MAVFNEQINVDSGRCNRRVHLIDERAQMTDSKIKPFLMFQGKADEAMRFYVSLFPDAKILELIRYGINEPGVEGSIHKACFSIANQVVLCIDSPVKQEFDFTPALSFFVDCESEEEFLRLYTELAGTVLMPIGDYGLSRQFAWVNDRFGVSWQLNLRT
jgi:predicted 3-demethylubiquinone-9 3-methyltransferase (glyoxalase superfamily)